MGLLHEAYEDEWNETPSHGGWTPYTPGPIYHEGGTKRERFLARNSFPGTVEVDGECYLCRIVRRETTFFAVLQGSEQAFPVLEDGFQWRLDHTQAIITFAELKGEIL